MIHRVWANKWPRFCQKCKKTSIDNSTFQKSVKSSKKRWTILLSSKSSYLRWWINHSRSHLPRIPASQIPKSQNKIPHTTRNRNQIFSITSFHQLKTTQICQKSKKSPNRIKTSALASTAPHFENIHPFYSQLSHIPHKSQKLVAGGSG